LTATEHDVHIRPITGRHELALFNQLPYSLNHEIADDLETGRRRPGWLWLATRGSDVIARLAWWGSPDSEAPQLLDVLDVDDACTGIDTVGVLTALIRTAHGGVVSDGSEVPEYIRFVPPGWRDDPATVRAVAVRREALERTGARLLVERLRLEWRPGTPLASPTGRLRFRPLLDDAEVMELMTLVLEGTLDAHDRRGLERLSPREVATQHFQEELARYKSPRSWWRVAFLDDGDPVGFVMPARNPYHAIIAYIGVLPQHRGNGYVAEILTEGTRVLAEEAVALVHASTDVSNVPMAHAFERAGWVNYERQIDMVWEAGVASGS
jgi:RimJ/RimL family protein N-acetyltransferase